MEEALLLVPFSAVCYLLNCMPRLMKQGWDVEVLARTLSFVMKVHHEPIVHTKRLLPIIQELKSLSIQTVDLERVRKKPSSFMWLVYILIHFVRTELEPTCMGWKLTREDWRLSKVFTSSKKPHLRDERKKRKDGLKKKQSRGLF
jgi:hypothetical protein